MAKAMSVAMGIPQPRLPGGSWLTSEIDQGGAGHASQRPNDGHDRRSVGRPGRRTRLSRAISSPTTRKKMVMIPPLTQPRTVVRPEKPPVPRRALCSHTWS